MNPINNQSNPRGIWGFLGNIVEQARQRVAPHVIQQSPANFIQEHLLHNLVNNRPQEAPHAISVTPAVIRVAPPQAPQAQNILQQEANIPPAPPVPQIQEIVLPQEVNIPEAPPVPHIEEVVISAIPEAPPVPQIQEIVLPQEVNIPEAPPVPHIEEVVISAIPDAPPVPHIEEVVISTIPEAPPVPQIQEIVRPSLPKVVPPSVEALRKHPVIPMDLPKKEVPGAKPQVIIGNNKPHNNLPAPQPKKVLPKPQVVVNVKSRPKNDPWAHLRLDCLAKKLAKEVRLAIKHKQKKK